MLAPILPSPIIPSCIACAPQPFDWWRISSWRLLRAFVHVPGAVRQRLSLAVPTSDDANLRVHSGGLAGRVQKFVQSMREQLNAVHDKLLGDRLHGDSRLLEVGHGLRRIVAVLREAGARLAVVP